MDAETLECLGLHSTADLCSAHSGIRVMGRSLEPLFTDIKLYGLARTVRILPGENAAIHRAVREASRGSVLVVSGGDESCGLFGEILATYCVDAGIRGLVIEGTVRDSARLRQMRFPVFSLGTNPKPSRKTEPGEIGVEITCAGALVRPGDVIIGDDDGLVVVPMELMSEAHERTNALVQWEDLALTRLRFGESTCDIFGIE